MRLLQHLMLTLILISLLLSSFSSPAFAQHTQPRKDATGNNPDINSDAKADETRQLIAKARERQKSIDNQTQIYGIVGSMLFAWGVHGRRKTFGSCIPILRVS